MLTSCCFNYYLCQWKKSTYFDEAFLRYWGSKQRKTAWFCTTFYVFFDKSRLNLTTSSNPWELSVDSLTSVAFYIETRHLLCRPKQVTGFYMKRNTRLKWVKFVLTSLLLTSNAFNTTFNVSNYCILFITFGWPFRLQKFQIVQN